MSDHEIRRKYNHLPGLDISFPEENFIEFLTVDGIRLQTYRFKSKSAQAVVINFHGVHSYSNSHAVIGKFVSEAGCDFVGFDQRGHGKSEGLRGLIPSFKCLFDDSCRFVEIISMVYGEIPIYVTGSSMGGALSLALSAEYPKLIKGVIALNPALSSHIRCQSLVEKVLGCVSYMAPWLKLNKKDCSKMFESQEMFNYTEENPCIYTGRLRAGTVSTIAQLMKAVRFTPKSIKCDVLFIIGKQDEVIDPTTTRNFFNSISSTSKEFIEYAGVNHSIVSSHKIYEISERISQWIIKSLEIIE